MEETTAHHNIKHTIPKFPAPSPSQHFILGMVPTSCWNPMCPPPASVSSVDLQAGAAASCSLWKALGISITFPYPPLGAKMLLRKAWSWCGGGQCEAPERTGTGNSSFQKPFHH